MLEFRILGPLEVWHDGRALDLGGPRGRALLAVLLVHGSLTAEALVQALWGDDAPPTAAKALQVTVSRLRRALGPVTDRLETTVGGYGLRVEPGELDADRFEQACRRGAELPPREAAAVLREALALVRGPVLADQRYEPWAQPEIRRLEELQALAIEERVQADLALGEHARLVGELEALVAEHPLRERLRAQQMVALYRSGRHADALAAYRDARAALNAELGLEPGPELRALEQAILTHDQSLAAPAIAEPGIPPPPPTPTIGRDDDVRDVLAALPGKRLLTLTGPGGIGKTRLAIEVACVAGGRFVSLAGTADADRIPALICDTLMVTRIPGETDTEALDRALARGPLLLVLDNLEHLPDAPPLLADLLDRHTELQLLATSRQPLAIRAEWLFPVAPLVAGADVALFADRARARGFALSDDNAAAVAAICDRLAGMPLAIELAAARLGVLSPAALAGRLSESLGVLDRGPRDAPPRHRTMRATLDWSYDLLDDTERDAFTALAVFAGGCDLEAAEAVTGAPLTVIEALVDKCLVTMSAGRLTMLEPVREYAAERFAGRADAATVRHRHAAYFHELLRRTEESVLRHGRTAPEHARLRGERENLDAAVAWVLDHSPPLETLAFVGDFTAFSWSTDAPIGFLCEAAERALAAAGDDAPAGLRGRALLTLTHNAMHASERQASALAACELFREIGDSAWLVRALMPAANGHSREGNYAAGRALGEEALDHARRSGDEHLIGHALAQIAFGTPAVAEAAPVAREAAHILRRAGIAQFASGVLTTVAFAALREDAYEIAGQLGHEALDDAIEADDPFVLALAYGNLGLAQLLGGQLEPALGAFRAELVTARSHRFITFYFEGLLGIAALAAAAGDDHRAVALEAAAWAHEDRPPSGAEIPVYDRVVERYTAPARARLGEAWEAAAAGGRAMTADEAIAFALDPALLPH